MRKIFISVWVIVILFFQGAYSQVTQQVTAIQYYFNTDPGAGVTGNGAIVGVTPAANIIQPLSITVPNTLSTGLNYLYVRVLDENNRWSVANRQVFMVLPPNNFTDEVTAIQYYFDSDPGVGIPGNGAVVPVTPSLDITEPLAITIPLILNQGIHYLYTRVRDENNRWSVANRQVFMVLPSNNFTDEVTAIQYYFDTDPGVGITGNGAVVPVTPSSDITEPLAITIPGALGPGVHYLYTRVRDENNRWSVANRQVFMVLPQNNFTDEVTAIQYYFDTDPGVGIPGNGAIVPVSPSSDITQPLAITIPGTLNPGIHYFYTRVRDENNRWSVASRQVFMVLPAISNTQQVVALEYYYDTDPGVGNGNPIAVPPGNEVTATVELHVPCLSTGTHYVYLRAIDEFNRWSIIGRDTISITSGVEAAIITPSGPVNICSTDSVLLSINETPGATYQWQLDNVDIPGATATQHYATASGNYTVKVTCGVAFSTSNTVSVSVQPVTVYYADADSDGYGTPANPVTGCVQPAGYVLNDTDCDDSNSDINPGMPEVCNGIDDNCNSLIDDGLPVLTYYADADSDGYGDSSDPGTLSCNALPGKVTNNNDCDDTNSNINPGMAEVCNGLDDNCNSQIDDGVLLTFYADADGDSYGDLNVQVQACTQPGGYVNNSDDCDDTDVNVNPAATEVCNGIDDNCNGQIDEGVALTFYADADNDGYGDASVTVQACTQPVGYVSDNTDCDDSNALIHEPVEYFVDADGDGYGSISSSFVCSLTPPAGYSVNNTDCDDTNVNNHPGATEICNGIDDDCDGLIDDADPSVTGQPTWYADNDGDGFGDLTSSVSSCNQPAGFVSNDDDCDDTDNAVHTPVQYYADMDGDGYGSAVTAMLCSSTAPAGYSTNNLDCDDTNAAINPGASEVCNGIDDNCNTLIDDGFAASTAASSINSSNGLQLCASTGTTLSVAGGLLDGTSVWVWYEGGCGSGVSVGTGNSISVTPGPGITEYFVRAEGDCDTTLCVSITLTIISAPAFTSCPADIVQGNDAGLCSAVINYTATASHTTSYAWSFSGATSGGGSGTGSGDIFGLGITNVTVTAMGDCGTDICMFDVTVEDTQDPVISGCPAAITVETDPGQWGATVTWTAPTASDNCAVDALSSTYTSGSFFNVGPTVITYTATDDAGNSSDCDFFVTVTPPDPFPGLNISIYTSGITFSDNNPDVNSTVNISAVVHNNSSENATGFVVRLTEMFTNTTYPDIIVSGLNAYQSTQVNWVVSTPGVPAFVPIRIEIDADNDLTESNPNDNEATMPFICGSYVLNGTIGVNTAPVPSSVLAGTTIQLCGNAFYDVTPAIPDSSVAGALVTITVVETGYSATGYTNNLGQFCISYQTPLTPGTYNYTVEVSDNTLAGDISGTFTTTVPVIACPLDLTVSISLTGTTLNTYGTNTITVGSSMTAVVHVHNNCQAVTQPTVLFIALPDGTPVPGPFGVPALNPGQTYNVNLSSMTFNTVGPTYISATVDFGDTITEDYEYNNTQVIPIIVLPLLPDIKVMSGSVLSAFQCESANQVMFNVRNIGTIASGSFEAVFRRYTNGILQATVTNTVFNLNSIQDTTLQYPIVPSLLTDSFSLEVDLPSFVTEINETNNNILAFPYVFQPCFTDLTVLGCDYTDVKPADPVPGNPLTVNFSIRNGGRLPTTGPFDVELSMGPASVIIPVTSTMQAGEVLNLSASMAAPAPLTASLLITVDSANDIVETGHENNNTYTASLCHEFVFTNVPCQEQGTIFKHSQNFCSPGIFRIGVLNNGLYEASAFDVLFEISGPGLVGWVTLGTESVYLNNTCGCPEVVELSNSFFYPQTGTYSVRMTADPLYDYLECVEFNNELTLTVNVTETADYKVLSSYITPSDLNPDINEVVSFNVAYENEGCTGFNQIELLSTVDNLFLATQLVPPLSSGGMNTVAIPNTWSSAIPGVHVFRAFIDAGDIISEAIESNNEATRAIIIGDAPDYHISSWVSNNISPLYGEVITLTTSIQNQGQTTGSGVLRFIYDDPINGEILLNEQSISIIPGNTITRSIPWVVVNPSARIIARVVNVTPIEFDLTDNEQQLQLNPLQISLTAMDVLCFGDNSGSISVTITGGQSPFIYQWSGPALFGGTVNVSAGTYTVTVTDANGITATASTAVSEPADLVINEIHIDASCSSESDGSIDISVTGGTPPYSYIWSNSDTTQDLSAIPSGTYTVTVTDDNNCTEAITVTIVNLSSAVTWYADGDGDTYGNAAVSTLTCIQPTGYVSNSDDCDDTNANINPAATEICNGFDDDCDGLTDDLDPSVIGQSTWYADADGDSYGNAGTATLACIQPTGYVSNSDDCNDTNANIHPAATEICNGIDDDCDGLTDDLDPSVIGQSTWYADADGDTYGNAGTATLACIQPTGYVSNSDDCDDTNANIHPAATEICNGIDDDCDGSTDEGLTSYLYFADGDSDGYGNPSTGTMMCNPTPPSGYVSNNTDCDDTNAAINPGTAEVCGNSVDDNCNGEVDENCGCVSNTAAVVTSVVASPDMIPLGGTTTITATFTDNPNGGPYEIRFNWNDGSAQTIITIPGDASGSYTASASHTYNGSAVFEPNVRVLDGCGVLSALVPSVSSFQYLVVYVVGSQFTTMGGWYNTPAGSYMADTAFNGKVVMGNVVKPQSGQFKGELELNINNMNFKVHAVSPTTWDYLAISGCCFAQFRGYAKINGSGNYRVIVAQTDNTYSCGQFGGNNMIRVKVWDHLTGQVYYDTQPGDPDNAVPITSLNGGAVKVHTQNSCMARPMIMEYDVNLFPNPASDAIYYEIESDKDQEIEMLMFDLSGRMIHKSIIQAVYGSNSGSISVEDLKRGVYLIEIRSQSGINRQKVVLN